MKNSKLRNITAVIAKVIEVISWVGAACIAAGMLLLVICRDKIIEAYNNGYIDTQNLTVRNGNAEAFVQSITSGKGFLFFIPFIVVLVLSALIFRNIYIIFQKSNNASPFSTENVTRIKRIGYYALAIPVSKIVMYMAFVVCAGVKDFELSVSLSEVAFGLVALCLAQYFAYGAELQREVDGLL